MSIAENLKRIRQERGLSQQALADKAGVKQQLISQIERGVNNTTKKLPEIARALSCEISDLDPNYGEDASGDDSLVMQKFRRIVSSNDADQLLLLDQYLDFLLDRNEKSEGSSR